jgi:DNA-binding response OmpR family regulator
VSSAPRGFGSTAEGTIGDMSSQRILVVEDDPGIRSTLRIALEDAGYSVVDMESGEGAIEHLATAPTDLVLVDLMLPGMSGFDVVRAVRTSSAVPIVIVTARSDSHDVVAGLEAGADDYVRKPFVVKELEARIRALLRRSNGAPSTPDDESSVYRIGDLEIRPEGGTVHRAGEPVLLTRTEFLLLCELVANEGIVLSREQLLERVWGYDYFGDSRLVDAHVRRLRTKIERVPSNPTVLRTIRGLGYKLTA